MKATLFAGFLFSIAVLAQDAESRPMHKQPAQASKHDHSSGVDERGDAAMDFDRTKTTHHFLLNQRGGIIDVAANSSADKTSVEQIQMHLQHITKAFARGDFSIPMLVHDQVPPGVPTMKRLRREINYSYEPTKSGARVVLSSANHAALAAIHEFLRFQIEGHRTGDSL